MGNATCAAKDEDESTEDKSTEDADEEVHGQHVWQKCPGPVYILARGLNGNHLQRLQSEIDSLRRHPARHVRGPFHCYDDLADRAKMLCTYNYYTAPRPGEPVPQACLAIANEFLADFGEVGRSCLVIEYPKGSSDGSLPWHVDMSGCGGRLVTMSWGSAATFRWKLEPELASGGIFRCHGDNDNVYTHCVEEGDIVFFDGGSIEHMVESEGERYVAQVRLYGAASELDALPWGCWRRGYECERTRYPYRSSCSRFYVLDRTLQQHASGIRFMYIDLLIRAIRNETHRETASSSDVDSHDLAQAEAYLRELKARLHGPMSNDMLQLLGYYVDLLKKLAAYSIHRKSTGSADPGKLDDATWARAQTHHQELRKKFGDQLKLSTGDVYGYFIANDPVAHSLGDRAQLENTQSCVELVLADGVPGDLIETGVWQGGQTILMRGILRAHGIRDRVVYVADSFQGLPEADLEDAPDDALALGVLDGIGRFRVTADLVRENFSRYGLLDKQVVFLEGWFQDTLPNANFGCFSLIRLDGDFYDSTCMAIEQLYPRLSRGGFVIVDDYGCPFGCKRAIDEYRDKHKIVAPLFRVSSQQVFWRKP